MISCPRCNNSYSDEVETCPNDGEPLAGRVSSTSDEDLPPGTMVGEYRISGKLGEGGFGAVYRAAHHLIDKAVAIKVLNRVCSADPALVSRFTAEARVVNQIKHRNIVDIFAFGRLPDGRHYHVMELLDGVPLDEHLKERGRLSFAEAAPIFRGVARALAAAHAANVVHRDLKPANIFLVRDEDSGFVAKLIDFGIAKLHDDQAAHKTKTGAMMGTAYYMSPEQCRGRGVDARTDIYAFGVVVHVTLTGKKLFEGESVMDVVMKQITDPPPPMSSVEPSLSPALDAVVLRMLEKDPSRRPQTITEALSDLLAAGSTASPDRPSTAPHDRPASSENTRSAVAFVSDGDTLLDTSAARPAAPPRRRAALVALVCLAAAAVGFGVTIPLFRDRSPSGAAQADGTTTASAAVSHALSDPARPPPSVTPVAIAPVPAPADSTAGAAQSATATLAPAGSAARSAKPLSPPAAPSASSAPQSAPAAAGTAAAPPSQKAPPPPQKPAGTPQSELDF